MIVWINGCHGAGKTSVSKALQRLLPGAWLFDPEHIGFALRRVWPVDDTADFKELPLWRELTYDLLLRLHRSDPSRPILVPMTLVSVDHHRELIGRLRDGDVNVHQFTLVAASRTLKRRLWWRPDWPSSRRWALSQVDGCVRALEHPRFAVHVATEGRTVAEVAEQIASELRPGVTDRSADTPAHKRG
jgi:hypothetical protein